MTEPGNQARRPAILTVDDDPAVSRAVARDLRRHYGERYRILRAESGADALETLKELKLRGDTVAVFVADYRMPQMSGIEFLEKAMDFFPLARRVLLTAYADTHAAIDAINVVDLDHYLLKPWDPPEEKLYPVIDGLLEEWQAVGDRGMPYTKVIVHRYSERSWEVRQFLARNQYSFRAVNADEPKGQQLLEAAGLDDSRLPVVITEKGETLVEPTDVELATLLGLSTSPALEMYELAVIGGGPAGLAAAVYGASEGLKTVLIEKPPPAGRRAAARRSRTISVFPTGVSGAELTTSARRQAERFGAEVITTQEAGKLDRQRRRRGAFDPAQRGQHHRRARRHPRHRRRLPPAADHRVLGRPRRSRAATTSAAASSTARRCPTTASARVRTSTSSAAPTRPGRPRCTCRRRPSRSPC